jgi:hypothetical protein
VSTSTATKPSTRIHDQNQIVIERREIIGVVPLSSNGTENPIVAAYKLIGEHFSNSDEPMKLSFDFAGHTFQASHEPTNQEKVDSTDY